jgi:hypothetical protein
MKRYLVCSVILLFLLSFSCANATLLGVDMSGYPDITIDGGGTITFTPNAGGVGGGALAFVADDLKITYSDGTSDPLSGLVDFIINWSVDSSGKLLSGGTMAETVKTGKTAIIKGVPYGAGIVLLTGPVIAFGWDNIPVPVINKAFFDFAIFPTTGALVTAGVWPANVTTNIAGFADDPSLIWPSNWWNSTTSFTLNKTKADKAPTPEPGTLMLMGTGLAGMAGYARLRLKRRKKA